MYDNLVKFIDNSKFNNNIIYHNSIYYFFNQEIKNNINKQDNLDIEYEEYNNYNQNHNQIRNEIPNNIFEENDPWEDSINDNKFYINNRIARIFPQMKIFTNYGKLKIDDDSFSYITIREIAELISKIISYHLLQFNINPQKSTIIDYTSGVGGNVLSFSKYFLHVHAIEISVIRAEYLKNNIDVYGYKNIHVINESAIDYNENSIVKLNPNVIFIDPPWGGADYKNLDVLTLKLGDVAIEDLIKNIIEKFSIYYNNFLENIKEPNERIKITLNNYNNKLIVLKLPKNYDIEYFYKYIKNINSKYYLLRTYLYILNKMLIIVVELTFIAI
jgi:16S rRNA G966 N2-methylase RsmD